MTNPKEGGGWQRSVCPLDCPDGCGLLVKTEGDRLTAIKGDPDHPFTKGFVCPKARWFPRRLSPERRITAPLVRSGPKGSGRFQEVGWDQALDLLVGRIGDVTQTHGAESILPYSYAGHMGLVHRGAGEALFHAMGATKLWRTICSGTASAGLAATLGPGPSTDIMTAAQADLVIIWGNNTLATNLHAWPVFQEARKNGAEIVVIDPYLNATARKADRAILLRPGSDAALALGMMSVLFAEGLADEEYLERMSLGWRELKERAAQWPPQRAAQATGVPAEVIVDLARAYGKAKAPFLRLGWGPSRQPNGGMIMRTVSCLPVVVGAFQRPGGGLGRSLGGGTLMDTSRLSRADLAPPGVRKVNMVQLGQALTSLKAPPIKLLYVYLSNPAAVAPDGGTVARGLMRDDLFTVVHELVHTETTRFADLVLPSLSFLEMTDLFTPYGHNHIQMAMPVMEPVGQGRSPLSVVQELAGRLGLEADVFSASEEEIISWLIASGKPGLEGITLERLKQGKPVPVGVPANPYAQGFNTSSGKAELINASLEAQGLDPLPSGKVAVDPEEGEERPLRFITPPHRYFINSTFSQEPELAAKAGPPSILLHPDDAAARGIAEGNMVRVFNNRGECRLTARVADELLPGVAVAEGLYPPEGGPEGPGTNRLTSQAVNDMGGSCALHGSRVDVAPV